MTVHRRVAGLILLSSVVGFAESASAAPPATQPVMSVSVTVTDSSGKPLANVAVAQLGSADEPQKPLGQTDASGRIGISVDPLARTLFLATSPGLTPKTFGFWGAAPADYAVSMKPAGRWGGRLLDENGKPRAGRTLTFRMIEMITLMPFNYRAGLPYPRYDLTAVTDADGRFALDGDGVYQPWIETVTLDDGNVIAGPLKSNEADYRALMAGNLMLSPSTALGEPIQWNKPDPILPPLTVKLRVVDDATGRPVSPVRVSPGGQASPDQYLYTRTDRELTLAGPDISWRFDDGAYGYYLRVRAAGYADAPTRLVKTSEGNAEVELRLKPATTRAFTVVTSDGKPAAGAKLYLATPTRVAHVSASRYEEQNDWLTPVAAVTGADGVANVTLPNEAYRLAVAHDGGWAEIDPTTPDADKPARLTPWASATYRVRAGERPLVGVSVQPQSGYSEANGCAINFSDSVETDAAGVAELRRLIHDRVSIALIRANDPNDDDGPNWTYIDGRSPSLKVGQHREFTVMDGPHTVRARLAEMPGTRWQSLSIRPIGPPITLPANLSELNGEAREKAVEQAVEAVGKDRPKRPRVGANCQPTGDGSVGVIGLEPGTYHVSAYAPPPDGASQQFYSIDEYVVLNGPDPMVTDLGTLLPRDGATDSPLVVGKPVPELEGKTMDGQPFKLSDLRGKWVMVDFWGTWCGFCIREEPTLKDAYEGYAVDGRLVMVAVSVDDTVQQVKDHVAKNKLPWTQLVLGDRKATDVPQRFGVRGYPTTILIAPDGTFVTDELRGAYVGLNLLKHLGPPSPPRAATTRPINEPSSGSN